MLQFIPRRAKSILDVGCANGAFGTAIRGSHPVAEIIGIDPTPGTTPLASYDQVHLGSFPEDLGFDRTYDVICFNDVLEHMVDPWQALRRTHRLLAPETGRVVASLPNLRSIDVIWQLAVHGDFRYEDYGILDRTHLRFFTRRTMVEMFVDCGFEVESIVPINLPMSGKRGFLRRAGMGRLDELVALQYAIKARAKGTSDVAV
jgi:2-polyprenyl-3-methyl-5-hydroxy-6-metoxy-1,4-benzoquinol methylase